MISNIKDLPEFAGDDNRYVYFYNPEDEFPKVPEWAKTYVKVKSYPWVTDPLNDLFYRFKAVYYISETDQRRMQLINRGRELEKEGHVFRRSPVRWTGYGNRNSINRVRAKGIMAEYKHNLDCDQYLSEYQVVRRKRHGDIKYFMDWGSEYNRVFIKNWKRTKKKRQWM